MKRELGNWEMYRQRFGLSPADQLDLHFGRRDHSVSYDQVMADVEDLVIESLRKAQQSGRAYVMIIHGNSTSRPGQTTARSVVRRFMRSKEATPFVVKADCIQHPTVFVAKVRASTDPVEA